MACGGDAVHGRLAILCLLTLGVVVLAQQGLEVQSFAVHIADDTIAGSNAPMTTTLWFDRSVYECDFTPTISNATYSCDNTTWAYVETSCADVRKVMITVDDFDAVLIDSITVGVSGGVEWTIDGWCVNTSLVGDQFAGSPWQADINVCSDGLLLYNMLCVDNQYMEGGNAIVDFSAISNQAESTTLSDASWAEAQTVSCAPSMVPTPTPTYPDSFVKGASSTPRAMIQHALGYSAPNRMLFAIGGSDDPQQLSDMDLTNDMHNWTDYGVDAFNASVEIQGSVMFYTQIDSMLYVVMASGEEKVLAFDLDTLHLVQRYDVVASILSEFQVNSQSCLCALERDGMCLHN